MSVNSPQSGSQFSLPAIQPGTTQVVAVGTPHAESTAVGGTCIRLAVTGDTWVQIGAAPVADKTTSLFLPAGTIEYFCCKSTDLVSVLQDSAGGKCSITPGLELGI